MERPSRYVWLLLPLLVTSFFIWGVLVGQYKVFPHELLRGLKHLAWDNPAATPAIFSDIRGRIAVKCPRPAPIIVAIGQSNGANVVPGPVGRRGVPAYNFYNGQCFAAEDPLLGTGGNLGSIWTPLAQNLAGDGFPLVLIAGAVSGSTIAEWLPGERGYWPRIAAQLAQAKQAGLLPEIVIWLQGEADAAAGTSRQTYSQALTKLIDLSRTESSEVDRPAWIIFQATVCGMQPPGTPAVRAAQAEVIDEARNVYLGMDSDALDGRYRYDGCHFNAAGRNLIVDKIANLIRDKRLLRRVLH